MENTVEGNSKFYHRGKGECISILENFWHLRPYELNGSWVDSKPVTAHCPSTAPIGFLDGWVEGYQGLVNGNWTDIKKITYDIMGENDSPKRLFLTPPVSTGERKEEEKMVTMKEMLDYGEWARVNGEMHRGNLQKNGIELYNYYLKDKERWVKSISRY